MKIKIYKGNASGNVVSPPSKSYAHRLLIASFLSNKKCKVSNVEFSNDINATLSCLKELGASFVISDNEVIFDGNKNKEIKEEYILNCGESGSTIRFLIPIALVLKKNSKITMKGTPKLISRGLSVYEEIFKKAKVEYSYTEDSFSFKGRLLGSSFSVPGDISSQYISGLIFALSLLKRDTVINIVGNIESLPYINLTIDTLDHFGVIVKLDGNVVSIMGHQKYARINSNVEGDFSNAAFLEALNYVDKNNNVNVKGLNYFTRQGDSIYMKLFPKLEGSNPTIDISNCIDLGPVLFSLASTLNGATIKGIKRLRIKESDRVATMVSELKKFGANIEVYDDYVVINKKELESPKEILLGHNDHRIVMALAILLTKYEGIIDGVEAIDKSFPTFFNKLKEVGVNYEIID